MRTYRSSAPATLARWELGSRVEAGTGYSETTGSEVILDRAVGNVKETREHGPPQGLRPGRRPRRRARPLLGARLRGDVDLGDRGAHGPQPLEPLPGIREQARPL